jgi:DNA-binding transcriptional MerR regulator
MYAAVVQLPVTMKSPEAFRTISEVSAELDVPQHVLRFWESRFTQIRPTKRAGGRRYYRPEDVDLLRGIRMLLYSDGYTIKGVQKVLRERGPRYVADIGHGDAAQEPEQPSAAAAPAIVRFERGAKAPASPESESLEILLAELLQLKGRLRAARRRG